MSPARWLTFVLLITAIFSCSHPNDQQIKELFNQMKAEAEALNSQALCRHISKHYQDNAGYNYFVICNLIKRYVDGLDELKVRMKISGIILTKNQARASLELVVRAKRGKKMFYLLGSNSLPEYPTIWLQKEGRSWKIIKVEGIKAGEEESWW